MASAAKLFFVPGSIPFFFAGLILGVVLLYGGDRPRRWGRAWLTVLLLVYGLLSTPLGSGFVAAPLVRQLPAITSKGQAAGVDTIVVLSNGGEVYGSGDDQVVEMGRPTAHNALEAARLYRLLSPALVVASGGIVEGDRRRVPEARVLADGLVRLGIPSQRIVLETQSRNTNEQAVNVAAILKKRGVRRVVLVTAPTHVPRARDSFRRAGLDPLPSAPPFVISAPSALWHRLRPGIDGLEQSEWSCYEYLARVYYWGRERFGGNARP